MNRSIIPTIFFSLLLVGGLFFFFVNSRTSSSQTPAELVRDNIGTKSSTGYQGRVLVEGKSPFIEFTQADYEKALEEDKIIILDFYAEWCPICRGEAPILEQGFRTIDNPRVIGFRVNFNDTSTDEDEKKLAKEFDVTYQHTKVILRNGHQVLKDGEIWDIDTFLTNVRSIL